MRTLPLKEFWQAQGASFAIRYDVEIVERFSDHATEYKRIRDNAALTDFSHIQIFRIPEAQAFDVLDGLVAGNVAKVRYGRMLHTFIANEQGELLADCYIANNDDEFIVLCESIVPDAEIRALFMANSAVEDLTGTVALLSVDGVKAWSIAKELFGADVLGLPYLSIEKYQFDGHDIRLFRAGKTSEFGYMFMAPLGCAQKLAQHILDSLVKLDGGPCGCAIHNDVRLEGRFFNIYRDGAIVKNPLSLGIQWMIDFDKEKFTGRDTIFAGREAGLSHKIIGISVNPNCKDLKEGAGIFCGAKKIATVVTTCHSYLLDCDMGLALFDNAYAFAGLEFNLGSAGGAVVKTISMPPIMPKSLMVKLDEM